MLVRLTYPRSQSGTSMAGGEGRDHQNSEDSVASLVSLL